MLHKVIKGIAPVFAMAAAFSVGACDGTISVNGDKGVPLEQLDLTSQTPREIVLAGPDNVIVTQGSALTVDVSGDPEAVAALRFTLDDDTLGIMREKSSKDITGKARVAVTLPSLEKIVLAGSGTLDASNLSGESEVVIAGSGSARTANVDASQLEVTIAGAGTYRAGGKADSLDLTVAGSGSAEMNDLKVGDADITIAGSGNAAFASDGTVKASIMGSGEVTVTGSAKCTISSMGSGKLNCQAGATDEDAAQAPTAPKAPGAPVAPQPPTAPDAPESPSPDA